MTPEELARQIGVSPKALRSWLRRERPRSAVEAGRRWYLDPEAVEAARRHYRSEQPTPTLHRPARHLLDGQSSDVLVAPVHSRREVLSNPCPVPAKSGVYGWWFREIPGPIDVTGCIERDGLTMLYVGISPKRPPSNGRPPSTQTLRDRVRYHYRGNAEGSTLRKTLGVLLEERIGTALRRVGSGRRMTFADHEPVLSDWMDRNAYVSWANDPTPWETEASLIGSLDVPLNLDANSANTFHATLATARAAAVRKARDLPVLP